MAILREQIDTVPPLDRAFNFVADFANSEKWDPGVATSERSNEGPTAVGARYRLGMRMRGKVAPMDYEITASEPSRRVVLTGTGAPSTAGMEKDFFVSPFISIKRDYAVDVRDEPAALKLAINIRQVGRPMLSASLVLRRRHLADRSPARVLLRHPLVTRKTIGLIPLHALRLWLRGAPSFRHADMLRAREASR